MKKLLTLLKIMFCWGLAVLLIHGFILSLYYPYTIDRPQPVFGQIVGMIGCVILIIKPFEYIGDLLNDRTVKKP